MKINNYQAMEMTQLTRGLFQYLTTVEPRQKWRNYDKSGGGRLREMVAYETLDHNGSEFFLIRI